MWKPDEDYDTIPNPDFPGYSHIPQFFANNADFATDPTASLLGSYEYRIELKDAQGNGWNVTAPFAVVPEPGSMALFGLGMAGLAAYRRASRSARR